MEPMTYMEAMKHFFGFKPGFGLKEFFAECKALAAEDKAEMVEGLVKNGYTIKAS